MKTILLAVMIAFALCIIALLIRAIKGPRFTDRVVSINAVNTLIICTICVLSKYLEEDFLIDVALIYALLGFLVNTLLMRQILDKKKEEEGNKE